MSDVLPNNIGTRLFRLIERAETVGHQYQELRGESRVTVVRKGADAMMNVFRIEEDRTSHASYSELLRCMTLLAQTTDQLDHRCAELGFLPAMYNGLTTMLREVSSPISLNKTWSDLKKDLVLQKGHAQHLIIHFRDDPDETSAEEAEAFLEELTVFLERLNDMETSEALASFIERQTRVIIQAIRASFIIGDEAFREASDQITDNVIARLAPGPRSLADEFREEEDGEAMTGFKKHWRTVSSFGARHEKKASRLLKAADTGVRLAELLGKAV